MPPQNTDSKVLFLRSTPNLSFSSGDFVPATPKKDVTFQGLQLFLFRKRCGPFWTKFQRDCCGKFQKYFHFFKCRTPFQMRLVQKAKLTKSWGNPSLALSINNKQPSVCERRVNLLVYSLSLHRHSYIGFILAFVSSIHNKQTSGLSSHNKQVLTDKQPKYQYIYQSSL